jgi:hypothetical protein
LRKLFTLSRMNIQIDISSAALRMSALLKPEAMEALLSLIQTHRAEATGPSTLTPVALLADNAVNAGAERSHPWPDRENIAPAKSRVPFAGNATAVRLGQLSMAAAYTPFESRAFPERLLLLTGWAEAHGRIIKHKRDILQMLVELQEMPPANPGRDFRAAGEAGWIKTPGPELGAGRLVTDDGWRYIENVLNGNGNFGSAAESDANDEPDDPEDDPNLGGAGMPAPRPSSPNKPGPVSAKAEQLDE